MAVQVSIKGSVVSITFDLNADEGESTSGKTRLVASTHGGQVIGMNERGLPVSLSLNAYIPNK